MPSIEFGWFDEVKYTDLKDEEAKTKVDEYIEKGRKALPVQQAHKRQRRDDRRDNRNRGRRGKCKILI